jgi:F-type H+-transporting ATPase subunit a
MYSPLEQFDVKPLFIINLGGIELTLFDIFIPFIITISLFIYISFLKKNFKLIPSSVQYFFEQLVKFIYTVVKNQIGFAGYNYVPLVLTIFIFVLFANLLSLIPFGVSLTSHLIIIL